MLRLLTLLCTIILGAGGACLAQAQSDAERATQAQQSIDDKQLAATARLREQLAAKSKEADEKEKELQSRIDVLSSQNAELTRKLNALQAADQAAHDAASNANQEVGVKLAHLRTDFQKHDDPREPEFNEATKLTLFMASEYLLGEVAFDSKRNRAVMKLDLWRDNNIMPNEAARDYLLEKVASFGELNANMPVTFVDGSGRLLAVCVFKSKLIEIADSAVLDGNQPKPKP